MTWREQLVVRILLMIARLVADDPQLEADIKALHNHVYVNAPKVAA